MFTTTDEIENFIIFATLKNLLTYKDLIRRMAEIKVTYNGDFRTESTNGQSPIIIKTDNSMQSQQAGVNFSPVDMLLSSYGACMLSMMGNVAMRRDIDMTGATVNISYEMEEMAIKTIWACFHMKAVAADEKARKAMEGAAKQCPVGNSLRADIVKHLSFIWND